MNYKGHKIELKEIAGKERYQVNYQHSDKLWFIADKLENCKAMIERGHKNLRFQKVILSNRE